MNDDERGRELVERVAKAIRFQHMSEPFRTEAWRRLVEYDDHFNFNKTERETARALAREAIAAMREGEQKQEGEARAAGEAEVKRLRAAIERALRFMSSDPYADIDWSGDISGLLMSYAVGLDNMREMFAVQRDQAVAGREAAESLAKAEREGRESEGVAYRKEIAELKRENLRLCGEVSNRNRRALEGDQSRKAFDAEFDRAEAMMKERDEARGECQRMRKALELLSVADRNALDMATDHFESWIKHTAKQALGT